MEIYFNQDEYESKELIYPNIENIKWERQGSPVNWIRQEIDFLLSGVRDLHSHELLAIATVPGEKIDLLLLLRAGRMAVAHITVFTHASGTRRLCNGRTRRIRNVSSLNPSVPMEQ